MAWLIHLAIALVYVGLSAGFALVAPAQLGLSPHDARLIAAAVIFLGALVQFGTTALILVGRVQRLETRTRELTHHHKKIASTVSQLEERTGAQAEHSQALIQELKVLETLLRQVIERRGGDGGAAARAPASKADKAGTEPGRGRARRTSSPPEPLPVEEYSEEELLRIIRVGLNENRVDLYLQPIVALPSRRHLHYECFSRVRDAENRLVYPKDFMPLAASSGLVGTLDNLLLFRLIQHLRKLGRRRPETRFFCNIADGSVGDREFFPQFVDYMVTNREFADRLVFEFRAETFGSIDPETERYVDMLVRSGYRFSLDNVTAPSFEPERLAVRGVGYVKIPHDLLTDSLAEWAQKLRRHNVLPVAERVESESDVVNLLQQEIPLAQGFLFGEPRLAAAQPV